MQASSSSLYGALIMGPSGPRLRGTVFHALYARPQEKEGECGGGWWCNCDLQTQTRISMYHTCTCELISRCMWVSIFISPGPMSGMNEEGRVHNIRHGERRRTSMEMVLVSGLIYRPRASLSCIIRVQVSSSSL